MALKKTGKASAPKRVMDYQDTSSSGDSRAIRTRRITFSTTDAIGDAIENAAYDRHTNRSRLIEEAVVAYLGLDVSQ